LFTEEASVVASTEIEKRVLGKSGIELSVIGPWAIGFDTAELYSGGCSEELLVHLRGANYA
jgi:aryl-alcohol dehydrogenase-like predicted oxidoreductase